MERPMVVIELADDPKLARDISAGGVFVPGCTLQINSDCALLVRGPAEEIELPARVVYVDPSTGAGLELVGFSPALRDHLTKLMTAWTPQVEPTPVAAPVGDPMDDPMDDPAGEPVGEPIDELGAEAASVAASVASGVAVGVSAGAAARVADDAPLDLGFDPTADDAVAATADGGNADDAAAATTDGGDDSDLTDEEKADPEKRKRALTLHQRLRGLTLAQQVKIAQAGDPQTRIVLERFYNKNVWEPLLRNPRLTPPEVARIARMGALPRVLIELIVGNGGWLQVPEVRRALLANPRLGTDQILRVLRMLPKHELKLATTQTAYTHAVREAARRMLKDQVG